MAESSARVLTADEVAYIATARDKAFVLYEGVRTPHRSCGIALAETFGLPTPAYQALRRGGITGKGACGAIRAGEQLLGELLGDPSPTGAVTAPLRDAITWYQTQWPRRLPVRDEGSASIASHTSDAPDITCDRLVRPHGDFLGPARKAFCTNLAADVAALAAEALCRFAPLQRPAITTIPTTPTVQSP